MQYWINGQWVDEVPAEVIAQTPENRMIPDDKILLWDTSYLLMNYIQRIEQSGYIYYGFSNDTNWRIRRKDVSTGVWTVANGIGDFDTAWTDREIKVYGY